jgi:hypothetical protein
VPEHAGRFAGGLVQDGQADSRLVFVHSPGDDDQHLTVLSLTDPTGAPVQVDDVAFATSRQGRLLVVDQTSNTVNALSGPFTPGTVFVAVPANGSVAGYLGTLDLSTGVVTAVPHSFVSVKGLAFQPASPGD